jgi:hypothetical protein
MKNSTKKTLKTIVIISILLNIGCANKQKLTASNPKLETTKKASSEQKNEATAYESTSIELNVEAKPNQTTVVDLNFEDTKTSFSINYQKQTDENNGNYSISQIENLENPNANKISFAGNSGFVKKFRLDEEFDDKVFSETSKKFLQGNSTKDYLTTIPNSLSFNDSNYVAFKFENKDTNETIYGWLNLIITTDKITIAKMGYLDKLPLSIGN